MLEATYLLRLAYLAKFLNVGGLHVVQFQAFRKPFDEKLLFGWSLVPGSYKFRMKLDGKLGALLETRLALVAGINIFIIDSRVLPILVVVGG